MPHKLVNGHPHIPYTGTQYELTTSVERANELYQYADCRRSVREYSDRAVPREIIEQIIRTASTAPSGAHKQPWTFCAISDPVIKREIRMAAEAEEKENYESRMSASWKKDLAKFGTDMNKPFLETVPWLIIVFKQIYEMGPNGEKLTNYYVNESVGIACGMLINAIHHAGLATLTHTPSPMNFLQKILERPINERAFLLLPVGYPADDCHVPKIRRKGLEEMAVFY